MQEPSRVSTVELRQQLAAYCGEEIPEFDVYFDSSSRASVRIIYHAPKPYKRVSCVLGADVVGRADPEVLTVTRYSMAYVVISLFDLPLEPKRLAAEVWG